MPDRAPVTIVPVLLSLAIAAQAAGGTMYIDFEDLEPGQEFNLNQQFETGGVTVEPAKFFTDAGAPSIDVTAYVGNEGYAEGSGNELGGGGLLHFLPDETLLEATFKFGYYENEEPAFPVVNLRVGAAQFIAADLNELDGLAINGVLINVNSTGEPGSTSGNLTLTGAFNNFGVGGLSGFWIDDVELTTVPAPAGALALAGAAAIPALRRRRV